MSEKFVMTDALNRIQQRIKGYYAFLVSFILTFIFCYFTIWQLCILAGLIAGFFYTKMSKGALNGSLGVGGAWVLFVVIKIASSNVEILINQISGIVIGTTSLGWVFIVLIILLGFGFGALSGAIGSGIRFLIENRKKE